MSTTQEERFGPYVLTRRIAIGGMGELFLARRDGVGGFSKQVVVKRILPDLARDPDLVAMFLEEARVSALLDHSNIVHIYELGEVDGVYFLAMEYVDGRDLRQVLQRHDGPLELGCALTIISGVCEGLAFAHEARDAKGRALELVHRDLSPHNVLVSYGGAVKLTDFGIAKVSQRVSQTQVGVLKGKLGYLSPEQARSESIDQRSDIYSLGLLLFEATTGAPAVSSGSDSGYIRAARHGETRRPDDVLPSYPADLAAIFERATAPKRERRYATVREMQRAILAVQTNHKLLRMQGDLARLMRGLFDDDEGGFDEPVQPTEVVYGQTPVPLPSELETADPPLRAQRPAALQTADAPLRAPPPLGAGGTARRPRRQLEVVSAATAGAEAIHSGKAISGAYSTDPLDFVIHTSGVVVSRIDTDPDSVPRVPLREPPRAPRETTVVLEDGGSARPDALAPMSVPTVLVPEELDSAMLRRTTVFSEEQDTEPVTDVRDPTRAVAPDDGDSEKDAATVLVDPLARKPPAFAALRARAGRQPADEPTDPIEMVQTQVRDEPETLLQRGVVEVDEVAETRVRDESAERAGDLSEHSYSVSVEDASTAPRDRVLDPHELPTRPITRGAASRVSARRQSASRAERPRTRSAAAARSDHGLHDEKTMLTEASDEPAFDERPLRPVRPLPAAGQRRVVLWLILTALAVGMTAGLVIVSVRRDAGPGSGTAVSAGGGATSGGGGAPTTKADAGPVSERIGAGTDAGSAKAARPSADGAAGKAGSAKGSASKARARHVALRRVASRGRVVISAQPRMSVSWGARSLGRTPLRITLPVGRQVLLLRHASLGLTLRRVVRVRRRSAAALRVRLPDGKLLVKARPWARVSIDGKDYGITPLRPVSLSAGVHSVRLSNKRHGSVVRAVKVFPRRMARLVHVF